MYRNNSMDKGLAGAFLAGLFLFLSCGETEVLPKEGWTDEAHAALEELITECGRNGNDRDCRPYAVFDFDNTTIVNDISMTRTRIRCLFWCICKMRSCHNQ